MPDDLPRINGPRNILSITIIIILGIIALMVWGLRAHGQQPQQPDPQVQLAPKQPSQAQQDHIDTAIKDLQLTRSQQAQVESQVQAQLRVQTDEINKRTGEVRKELGLDDTWIYDFNTKKFSKPKAAPAEPAGTTAAPPHTSPAAPPPTGASKK